MGDGFMIAALVYIVACLGLVLFLQKQGNRLRNKVDALTVLVKEGDRQREALKRELQELRSGTIGVGRRLLSLERKLVEQDVKLDESMQQEPQAKLYSRAIKMVQLGAGVDELMRECELPKAEAELLIRMHSKH
ncbi:DUF2802 domain-containing protein [Shewanella yunxiaonensis]|uniref:DUF2802 domain-containing protein n=1 Tax=Shewanella yunxiaonensis TaxID=2829809 RepID=A0ABX7YXW2_9GAMM|nr:MULTISPECIES: DUF2802 domain-containing protein [Shewanella]MDF0533001.1 DUF2802 domain-containing protein [Shewanella sp. A32]QUN07537.1 DUF2802 domain-containing protein [Shewanella yunxiaonensis]